MTIRRPSKQDPSGTTVISNKFLREINNRSKWIKKSIKVKFKEEPTSLVFNAYDFPLDPIYLDEYSQWLSNKVDEGMLYTYRGPGIRVQGERWTDTYVQSAYQQGMANAYSRAGYAAVTGLATEDWINANFFTPFHSGRVELIYTRAYEQLKGFSDTMASQLRAELAQGIIEGRNPREIAKVLYEKIDGLTKSRAEKIARTETMRAHSEASLDTYETFQEEGVMLLVEFAYTHDDRVCPKCLAFAETADGGPKIMTVQEARGVLPLHPQCRCVWLPVPEGLKQT